MSDQSWLEKTFVVFVLPRLMIKHLFLIYYHIYQYSRSQLSLADNDIWKTWKTGKILNKSNTDSLLILSKLKKDIIYNVDKKYF